MRILIDHMPTSSKECIFAEYIGMTSKYKCMFKQGLYSRCSLDCNEECAYLAKVSDCAYYRPVNMKGEEE